MDSTSYRVQSLDLSGDLSKIWIPNGIYRPFEILNLKICSDSGSVHQANGRRINYAHSLLVEGPPNGDDRLDRSRSAATCSSCSRQIQPSTMDVDFSRLQFVRGLQNWPLGWRPMSGDYPVLNYPVRDYLASDYSVTATGYASRRY